MLSETTSNLEYFIDLRSKMEAAGQIIRTEVRVDLFEELSKGRGRNRLKRTIDAEREIQLGHGRMRETPHKPVVLQKIIEEKISFCEWYGLDHTGVTLRCRNESVPITLTEISGHRFCTYHSKSCLGVHTGRKPAVTFPNKEGYCPRCYKSRVSKNSPGYLPSTVPGIVLAPSNILSLSLTKGIAANLSGDRENLDYSSHDHIISNKHHTTSTTKITTSKNKNNNKNNSNSNNNNKENSGSGTGSGSSSSALNDNRTISNMKSIERVMKPVRSYRVVQIHDMWCEMFSSPKGVELMWGSGRGRDLLLLDEIHRREAMVQDIAAG